MVVNSLKFLSRLNLCWPASVYSLAANGTSVVPPHQGTHIHTGISPDPTPQIELGNMAEVGGFFDTEYVHGLMKANLTNAETVAQATLEFRVADMGPSGYDTSNDPSGGAFGQLAFSGQIRIMQYLPATDIEDPAEFASTPTNPLPIHTFPPTPRQFIAGEEFVIDVTAIYNASVGGRLGFRLEDVEQNEAAKMAAGAVVFDAVCLRLRSSATVSTQRLGLNVALTGGNAGWSRWFKDMGPVLSFYVANGASGVISASTGLPTSGDTKLTISTKTGTIFTAGDYTVAWGGTATSNGQASPRTINFNGDSTTLDFGGSGQVTSLSVKRVGDSTGQFTSTFLARARPAECLRLMESQRINEDGGTGGAVYDPSNPDVRIRSVAGANTFYHRVPTPEMLAAASIASNGSDLWYCFHHRVTDAKVSEFVSRLVTAGFNKTLYVEYSNEIWNTFPQGAWIENEAVNNSGGAYDGAPGPTAKRQAYYADRSDRIAELAKAAYANTRGVIASQTDLTNFFNNWTAHATRPLNFIDDLSVSWYFGGPPSRALDYEVAKTYTASQLASLCQDDWDTRVKGKLDTWKSNADSQGWGFVLYEGGSHCDRILTGGGADPDAQAQDHFSVLSQTTEMAVVHATVMDEIKSRYGDPLALVFQDVGNPSDPWSWLGGELVSTSPRWQEYILRRS